MTVCIDFTVVIVAYFLSAFCPAVDIASCFALFALEVASAEAVLIAEVFASFAFLVASLAAVLIISCLIVVISVEETLLLISPSSTLNCDVTSFLYSVKAFSESSGAGDQSVDLVPVSSFQLPSTLPFIKVNFIYFVVSKVWKVFVFGDVQVIPGKQMPNHFLLLS